MTALRTWFRGLFDDQTEHFVLQGEPHAELKVQPRVTVEINNLTIVITVTGIDAKGGEVSGTARPRPLLSSGRLNSKGQCTITFKSKARGFDSEKLELGGKAYLPLEQAETRTTPDTSPRTIDLF